MREHFSSFASVPGPWLSGNPENSTNAVHLEELVLERKPWERRQPDAVGELNFTLGLAGLWRNELPVKGADKGMGRSTLIAWTDSKMISRSRFLGV